MKNVTTRFTALILIFFGGVAAAAAEPATIPRPAVLIIKHGLYEKHVSKMMLEASVALFSGSWKIGDFSANPDGVADSLPAGPIIWPEFREIPECGDRSEVVTESLLAGFKKGRKLFFEEMDTSAAVDSLQKSVRRFLDVHCLSLNRPTLNLAGCRAGVLLSRLYLLTGCAESATGLVSDLGTRCTSSELQAEDVPPDVRAFVSKLAGPSEDKAVFDKDAALLKIRLVSGESERQETQILVDGIPAKYELSENSCRVSLKPGAHFVDIVDRSGAPPVFRTADFRINRADQTLVTDSEGSAVRVAPGVYSVKGDMSHAARVIGQAAGASVLGLSLEKGTVSINLLYGQVGKNIGQPVLNIKTVKGGLKFVAPDGSPVVLVKKSYWPWPWISGVLSTGLLGTGITLNVLSNQSANSDVAKSSSYRDGAIAGYSLAGAGILATVLLAVLRPVPEQTVTVVPSSSGFSVMF